MTISNPAQANEIFNLEWSGAFFGNDATATGFIEFDPSSPSFNNPGFNQTPAWIVDDFEITITGASSGNGTFDLSDFDPIILELLGPSPFDFSQELIGQNPSGVAEFSPLLPPGSGGDFNIFSNGSDPRVFFFQIATSGGVGDSLLLTSFAPAASTPEPTAILGLIGVGILGVNSRLKRK